MPPALKNEPKLDSHLLPYLDAYNTLRCHRTRSESGYNPIDYTALVTYANLYGYTKDLDEFDRFCILVQSCDHAFLSYADEKQAKAIKSMSKK